VRRGGVGPCVAERLEAGAVAGVELGERAAELGAVGAFWALTRHPVSRGGRAPFDRGDPSEGGDAEVSSARP
jgi:hypothetical protein